MKNGELINTLYEVGINCDAIIKNARAYTHTSVDIGNASSAIESPIIGIHISILYVREEDRHRSSMANNCIMEIAGIRIYIYKLTIQHCFFPS